MYGVMIRGRFEPGWQYASAGLCLEPAEVVLFVCLMNVDGLLDVCCLDVIRGYEYLFAASAWPHAEICANHWHREV